MMVWGVWMSWITVQAPDPSSYPFAGTVTHSVTRLQNWISLEQEIFILSLYWVNHNPPGRGTSEQYDDPLESQTN